MFSKSIPADAKSTYSVSSTATTLKGAEASSKKWSLSTKKDSPTTAKPSKSETVARHNEAIATYLAFR